MFDTLITKNELHG